MKVTLGQLVGSSRALDDLMSQKLPASLSFRLARVGKRVKAEIETYAEQQGKLLEQHARPVEGEVGQFKFETDDERNAYNEQMKALLDTELEINAEPIPIKEFGDGFEISSLTLMALDWLIVE